MTEFNGEYEGMELRAYVAIIQKWFWLAMVCMIVGAGSAYVYSSYQTPIYEATSVVLLDNSKPTTESQSYNDVLAGSRLITTYAQLFTSREALDKIIEEWEEEPDILEIFVSPQRDTILLEVRVESDVPEATAFAANRLPEIIGQQQRARQTARYEMAKVTFEQQLDELSQKMTHTGNNLALVELEGAEEANKSAVERLKSELSLQEKTYQTILQDISVINLAQIESTNLLTVVEGAQIPQEPIRPNTLLNTLLAAIVGVMIGLGMGFLMEYLDNTLKPHHNLARMFGLNTLAFIGQHEAQETRFLIDSLIQRDPIVEAYRMLRTNIRLSSIDDPLRVLLVTSPDMGEGKSTTTANLAVVLAQAGYRTILIDADLRRPVQHQTFNLKNSVGLTTALVERDKPVKTFLQPTSIRGLQVLASGPLPPNPAELLGSQRMRDVLNELQEQANLVLIDSPPVLAVADTSVLATLANGVLLVTRANKTRLDALAQTLEQLQSVQAKVLGGIVNDVVDTQDPYYYQSGYTSADSTKSSTTWGNSAPQHASLAAKMRSVILSVMPKM
ncbi:MAG: polysaccharide biosynthesis tyrosine autokinase [Ardenticatenaceae bacterium]